MKHDCFRSYTVTRGPIDYDVEVRFVVESWGDPGQYFGPPERCYPAEAMEGYIAEAWIEAPHWAKDKYPAGGIVFKLTDAERWELEDRIICQDPPEYPEPDYDYD